MSQLSPALLVVDDEDTNRNLLARLFESQGFHVDTAMNMPGMSGFDVLT